MYQTVCLLSHKVLPAQEPSPRFRRPTTAPTTVPSSPCFQAPEDTEPLLKKCEGAVLNFLSNLLQKTSQKTFLMGPETLLGQRNVSQKASQSLCDDTQDRRAAAAGWTGTCPGRAGKARQLQFPSPHFPRCTLKQTYARGQWGHRCQAATSHWYKTGSVTSSSSHQSSWVCCCKRTVPGSSLSTMGLK